MPNDDEQDAQATIDTQSRRKRQNMAASVRSRLIALAHAGGEEPEYLLTRYALERLLYRLSKSEHASAFILKGALLFALWERRPHRATRDLDLLGFGPHDVSHIEAVFRDLCELQVEDDGLTFPAETIHARPIREQQEYGGVRVLLQALLGTARLRIQADVGFGDIVTPPAQVVRFPTLLDLPAPHLRVYPRETVVAEKFEAMVRLGLTNTRMKDFYDLYVLAERFTFHGPTLRAAISATFARRGAAIPKYVPLALTPEFADDRGKQAEWQGFLMRNKLGTAESLPLAATIGRLGSFLLPPLQALNAGAPFEMRWRLSDHWQPEGAETR